MRRAARSAGDERRPDHRDLQGRRPAGGLRRRVRARRSPRQPRARAHAGWRPRAVSRPRGPIRSRPVSTSASSTTAPSRITTRCAGRFGARASSSRRRTTPRSPPDTSRWRLPRGASLEQALEGCLDDLDGFYTFAVGTADGFAVLRDPIACKPAVLAETDDWVAMASEYHAIAVLPGAEDARMWEPEPGIVYVWDRAAVA